MKKLLTITLAIAMVFGVALTAQAINTVQMTLTSPAITKTGCERVGSATFGFDAGSTINQGDWWYMDLPSGTMICNTVDYVLTSGATNGTTTDSVNLIDTANLLAIFGGTTNSIGLTAAGVNLVAGGTAGPYSLTDISSGGTGVLGLGNNGLAVRVYAPANGQRVWMYAYGTAASDYVTVPAGTQFNIKVLGGSAYNGFILLDSGDSNEATTGDMDYGNNDLDDIGVTVTKNVPYIENTLCVNAEGMSGDLMFTSFFSKNNEFTFTGDSQIAHVASANPIALAFCKGNTSDNIEIGAQNSCFFDFEAGTNYCTTTFAQRLFIQGASVFGDIGDRYDISVQSNTAGVYFNGTPTLNGYVPSATNECTANGAAIAAAWTSYVGSTVATGTPGTTCSVAAANRIDRVTTINGGITNIETYDAIWIDLPNMAYDTTVIGNGTEAQVTVTLSKYPCGVIFTGTHTLGTFVTTCPASTTATTTLLFPWFPPMDGSLAPWWGGFVIVNAGTGSGTAALTFWETDGDSGTLTTPSIAPGMQYNPGALSSLISQITPASGNTGAIGDSNFAITATCNFAGAGGFAFTGNGIEGTGYTAYIGAGGAWQ